MRTSTLTTILGISYRQADWLTRTGILPHRDDLNQGSGTPRLWDTETVERLYIAKTLHDAAPHVAFPRCVEATMTGPPPPRDGYVILDPAGDVHYFESLAAIVDPGGVITAFSLDALLVAA